MLRSDNDTRSGYNDIFHSLKNYDDDFKTNYLYRCYTVSLIKLRKVLGLESTYQNTNGTKTTETPMAIRHLPLRWRHNDHDGGSNHQPHGCLLNRLFRRKSKETSKLRVTGLCVGNSPGPVNSPHKGPVMRKMFPFDDVIMPNDAFILLPTTSPIIKCKKSRKSVTTCDTTYSS